jgi:hypothetical protein
MAGQTSPRKPAWAISFGVHLALFVVLALAWKARPAGTSEVGGPVGIAVVYESSDTDSYELIDAASISEQSQSSASAAETLHSALPAADAATAILQDALAGLLPSSDGAPADPLSAGGALGLGDGIAELGGSTATPKVKSRLFGIEGEGSRFLYVFDRSDSMNGFGGRPFATAKRELLASLDSIGPAHEFQIIFYNDSPLPFGGAGGAPRVYRGDAANKSAAQTFVRDVPAFGGTQHIDALRMALSMRPDVLFFLTDGDFPSLSVKELENLHDRASRVGATIHCVQFGSGPNQGTGKWIEQLAAGTQGQYRYVDVTQSR